VLTTIETQLVVATGAKWIAHYRLIRIVDFTAESLEAEADRVPPSMKEHADSLRKMAKIIRQSDNPRMVRVWEEQGGMEGPDFIRPDPASY
jgi:hypothetical protein